jgi:hypothetical protein
MNTSFSTVEYQDYTAIRLIAKAEVLREMAKELATLAYVRPEGEGREEYEAMLAIRRGNTDAWLKEQADKIEEELKYV